ncbi:MAG: hypothetical protein ABW292_22370, partial [Vicinamibacterales bacterium]
ECWVLVLVLRATCSVPRCGEARRSVYGAKAAGAIVAVSAFLATAPLSAQWLKYPTASRILAFGKPH